MEMISQQMILGSDLSNIGGRAAEGYYARPKDGVLVSRKSPIPATHDPMTDIESTRLMEERYGIKEEGLF